MAGLIPAITGALTALPKVVELAESFTKWINKVSGNDPAGYIVKMGQTFSKLSEAKTPEEHSDAAKDLAKLIRGMPSN